MSIQEIPLSNNQKKRLLKITQLESILFQDDNGDLVVNSNAYRELKDQFREPLIEPILIDQTLNFDAEYFVFS